MDSGLFENFETELVFVHIASLAVGIFFDHAHRVARLSSLA